MMKHTKPLLPEMYSDCRNASFQGFTNNLIINNDVWGVFVFLCFILFAFNKVKI
jgi:hypothetical protein